MAISYSGISCGFAYDSGSGSITLFAPTGASCVAGVTKVEPASNPIEASGDGFSLAKSSGDFSRVEGVSKDPDATVVSSISIIWLTVTVSSGTTWAARGHVPVFTLAGFGALIKLNKSISVETDIREKDEKSSKNEQN
ncbi:hypothetical protein Tco_1435859 [Tanacetum coccineum]